MHGLLTTGAEAFAIVSAFAEGRRCGCWLRTTKARPCALPWVGRRC